MNDKNKPYKIIKLDKHTGRIHSPTLLLMNRSFDIIGKISRYDNWNISLVANGIDEISFDVHKYADGKLCPVWEELEDLKIVDVDGFGRFEISVDYTDHTETIKSIHGQSLEVELAQICLYEFHVNDEEAMDAEYTGKDNYDSNGKYIPTTFYRKIDKDDTKDIIECKRKHSLLDRVLADRAPHWSIGHVTSHIALDEESNPELSSDFQRTYTVDGDSIYDFLTGTVAKESNVVFIFDTIERKINCYSLCDCINQTTKEIECSGFGEDTMVFISKNKLANEISISSNKDNVKNCFRIEGGDDIITDMVLAANMNGSNYINVFADFQYNDMSETLRTKLKAYQIMMSDKKTQDEYYGYGDIDSFLNSTLTLKVESELDAASILNICGNNKVNTGNVTIYDSASYWYIVTISDNTKELRTSKTVRSPYKTVKTAIETMGIFLRLCNAYDELTYFESAMMPNTNTLTEISTAKEQYENVFKKINKSTVAVSAMNNYDNNLFVGVTNNIKAYAQIFLDSRFDLEIIDDTPSYTYTKGNSTGIWKGKIRIRQHTDETNVYPTDISEISNLEITVNDNTLEFAKQKIHKALSKGSMLDIDFKVAEMAENDMKNYFNQYSLNRLKSFYDGYNSCISILTTLGETITSDVRDELYETYQKRREIVEGIKNERENAVAKINNTIKEMKNEQNIFQYGGKYGNKYYEPHDFRTYIGEDLYLEFSRYRREDTYKNDNYVSDGKSTSECMELAKELIEVATKEAKKACVLQRTISTSLNNLFALPEFEPFYEKFALFNYIRVRPEDEILKLRLIGVEFSGESPEEIQVTFSDQIESIDGKMSDLQSIIQQAGNMATSYSSTVLQAKKGSEAKQSISDIFQSGLNAAKTMLTNNDNNEITITPSGIICKRMDDEGFYGDKQIRITGNIMAFTKNNWKSVEMAIGETTFYNPSTKQNETKYGILSPAIVGELIVGENLFIGNKEGSVQITGNGIKITNGNITWGDNVNAPEIENINGLDITVKNAAEALKQVKDISDDSKVTPVEKQNLKLMWTEITSEKTSLIAAAKTYNVKYSSYETAYNNLDTYLSSILNNLNTTTNIVKNTFDTKFEDYYTQRDTFHKAVDTAEKKYVDDSVKDTNKNLSDFKDKVNHALMGSATTEIGKDFILSPKIGGGYMYITGNNGISIEINPKGTEFDGHNEDYVFNISKNDKLIMGVDNNGNGHFSGNITGAEISGSTLKSEGQVGDMNGKLLDCYIEIGNGSIICDDSRNQTDIFGGYIHLYSFSNGYRIILRNDSIEFMDNNDVIFSVSNNSFFVSQSAVFLNDVYISDMLTTDSLIVNNEIELNGEINLNGALNAYGVYSADVGTRAPNLMIGDKYYIRRTSGSSKRFKDNIKTLKNKDLDPNKLYDVDIMQYKFKRDYLSEDDQRYNQDVIGFIAEDIFEKYPIAADYSIGEDGKTIVNDWNFRYIIPAMLKLIQDQKKELDILKHTINISD